jgi:hypothetical protein
MYLVIREIYLGIEGDLFGLPAYTLYDCVLRDCVAYVAETPTGQYGSGRQRGNKASTYIILVDSPAYTHAYIRSPIRIAKGGHTAIYYTLCHTTNTASPTH